MGADRFVRADLAALPAVAHGSIGRAELEAYGLVPSDVLDFSVNTNPLGPAECVRRAIAQTDWTRYPGDDERPLRRGLAQQAGLDERNVVLGNGSADLLWWLALAVLRAGDTVAIATETFGEYAHAVRAVGAHVVGLHEAAPAGARAMVVCQPNNPTGEYLSRADVDALLTGNPERLLILDEAYAAFVEERWASERLQDRFANVVVARSMTKDHAVPGLRLGYLLAPVEIATAVDAVRPPWTVNAGALRAGLAALEPEAQAHVRRARAIVTESRGVLTRGFGRLGYEVRPSSANFLLVRVGNGAAFRRALLLRGCVVRDCASFGLPEWIRVACRVPADCERLLNAVEALSRAPV